MEPLPGKIPSADPMNVPRKIGATIRFQSSLVGIRLVIFAMIDRAICFRFEIANDFSDTEHAHSHCDEAYAVGEFGYVKRKPLRT